MFPCSKLSNQSCTKRGQQFFFLGIYSLLKLSSQALAGAQSELGQGTQMRKIASNFLCSMAEDTAADQPHKWSVYKLLINMN